jgi:hypothetical protein
MVPLARQLSAIAVLGAIALAGSGGCSGLSEEGEACDRDNGNSDCESGLICRGEWEVRAKESVCCPPPPAKPGVDACKPQIEHAHPDPAIDASYAAGGSGGSGGSSGTGGLDAGSDATDGEPEADADADATDGATDAPLLDSALDDDGG